MISPRVPRLTLAILLGAGVAFLPGRSRAAAEIKLDRDFLAGVVEKAPPCPFGKEGHYRGTVQAFRLLAIEPKSRRFLVACQVAGEFRPPLAKSSPDGPAPDHWKSFRFDLRVGLNIEPGSDGTPHFRVEVEDVRRRELEGFAGTVAKVLGRSFDRIVKQVAEGKVSKLNERLNAEIQKRLQAFHDYGVFCGIDYAPAQVVLRFDVTRYRSEGIAGYVFAEARPGTVPLYRWAHRRRADHLYTTGPAAPDPRLYLGEGIAGHVFDRPVPGSLPLTQWRSKSDHFYTTADDGQGAARLGYRRDGVACHVYPAPVPGTVPFYRFVDPRSGLHFYTTHPHAEFAK